MASLDDVKEILVSQGEAFESFVKRNDARIDALDKNLRALERDTAAALLDRDKPSFFGRGDGTSPAPKSEAWVDREGREIKTYGPGERLAADAKGDEPNVSIGRFLRGVALGGRAPDAKQLSEERKALSGDVDPSGGYTVAGRLAAEFIDALRANMVLSAAGARTVPMDTRTLTLARLDSDATASWHQENASIDASDPTLGAVTLSSRTVVAVTKLSVELSQDSTNIEQALRRSLTQSLAHAIDAAGMNGASANAAAAPRGIVDYDGRNTVTSVGAPTSWNFLADGLFELMLDNVPRERIGAMIAHPRVWRHMVKLATGISSDNSPLPLHPELAAVPKLWSTAAPYSGGNAVALLADWSDLLFGVRQQIQVRVIDQAFFASNLQLAIVASMRVDFAPAREASFCTIEGITVS